MKVAIYGYGNLGKGVECAVKNSADAELFGIFTRRDPKSVKTLTGAKVFRDAEILNFKNEIDVLIICAGSATDLPKMTPDLAKNFNVVDSFDTHKNIPTHFENTNQSAVNGGKTALISAGWDPGMFSLSRLYANAVLPNGSDYTFWGRGVSQGHSDAIRRIDGVRDARQYTVPVEEAVQKVRNGENPDLTTREKHTRVCYVVAQDGADLDRIENEIKTMPNYFADYDTTVHFISQEELNRDHSSLPHGGTVIRCGKTGLNSENTHIIEYSLKLDSNPEFTASVLLACARAVVKMNKRGEIGAKTMFDVRPIDLCVSPREEIIKNLL